MILPDSLDTSKPLDVTVEVTDKALSTVNSNAQAAHLTVQPKWPASDDPRSQKQMQFAEHGTLPQQPPLGAT